MEKGAKYYSSCGSSAIEKGNVKLLRYLYENNYLTEYIYTTPSMYLILGNVSAYFYVMSILYNKMQTNKYFVSYYCFDYKHVNFIVFYSLLTTFYYRPKNLKLEQNELYDPNLSLIIASFLW